MRWCALHGALGGGRCDRPRGPVSLCLCVSVSLWWKSLLAMPRAAPVRSLVVSESWTGEIVHECDCLRPDTDPAVGRYGRTVRMPGRGTRRRATTLYAAVRGGGAGMAWVRANGAVGGGGRARSGRVRNDPIRGCAGRRSRDGVGPRERCSRRWWPSTEWEGAQRPYTRLRGSAGWGWHGVARTVQSAVVAERGVGGCATTLYAATRGGRAGMAWAARTGGLGCGLPLSSRFIGPVPTGGKCESAPLRKDPVQVSAVGAGRSPPPVLAWWGHDPVDPAAGRRGRMDWMMRRGSSSGPHDDNGVGRRIRISDIVQAPHTVSRTPACQSLPRVGLAPVHLARVSTGEARSGRSPKQMPGSLALSRPGVAGPDCCLTGPLPRACGRLSIDGSGVIGHNAAPRMAGVAQVVERQVVVLDAVGSSPIARPIRSFSGRFSARRSALDGVKARRGGRLGGRRTALTLVERGHPALRSFVGFDAPRGFYGTPTGSRRARRGCATSPPRSACDLWCLQRLR